MQMKKASKNNQTSTATKIKQRMVFKILHGMFVAVPLIAGVDKYFNLITNWEKYISPVFRPLLPVSTKTAMRFAGITEVAIGLYTVKRPRIGSSLFALLMSGIIINLLTMPKQKHIASLDLCMAIFSASFALLLPDTENM